MNAKRRTSGKPLDFKSKLFAITFILSIVFGIMLFFTGKMYLGLLREKRAADKYEDSASLLQAGKVKYNRNQHILTSTAGDVEFVLTLDPELQKIAEDTFKKYNPQKAAFILADAETGEILVMASHFAKRSHLPYFGQYHSFLAPILRTSSHPMASIAKIVTASAAIEKNIAGPGDTFQCDGAYEAESKKVEDPKGIRHGKITMGRAMATSCNPTYAQVGLKVGRENLTEYFEKYMFNKTIPFDMPVTESGASIADGKYRLGMAAAGFEGSWMSPIHAVLIASTLENNGVMMKPYVVKEAKKKGHTYYTAKPEELGRIIDKKTADTISNMMTGTVNAPGATAYKGFYKNGKPLIKNMKFSGKTGSINGSGDGEFYTWFIGHASKGDRKLAFATMVVNGSTWSIKAASFTGQFFQSASKEIE